MKRFLVCAMLVLLMLVHLSAEPLLISMLGAGLDALSTSDGIPVELEGEQVFLGGSTLRSLKKTFKANDFLQLPFEQRSELYKEAKLSITWPVFNNLLAGFGRGSRSQGDLGGQLFGQIADWTAATTIGVGATAFLIDLFFLQIFYNLNNTSSSPSDDPLQKFAIDTMIVGLILLAAERVVQAIIPIPYGLRYNKALRNGLGVNKDGSDMLSLQVDLLPSLGMDPSQKMGIQVVGRVSVAL